jgi:cyclase
VTPMFRPRVIPVLLLDGRALVKTVRFGAGRYIGDPINAVKLFNDLRADELVFLDITATREKRVVSSSLIEQIGGEANMPFSVGGGIRSLDNVRKALAAGAEKVIINSFALDQPDFVRAAADTFGSSTVAVCMDVRRTWFKGERVFRHSSKKSSGLHPVEYAKRIEGLGAGELIVQSVDRDGMMQGYDLSMIRAISEAVSIPVVALGGAGQVSDLVAGYVEGCASALGAGSLFVYQSSKRGVLINYPAPKVIQDMFKRDRV